jgi:membrane-bound lytic murein transglycosylase D
MEQQAMRSHSRAGAWVLAALVSAGCANPQLRPDAPHEPVPTIATEPAPEGALQRTNYAGSRARPRHPAAPGAHLVSDDSAADEHSDLWARIRVQMAMPLSDHPSVLALLDEYARHSRHLDQVFVRAERYLHFVMEEIERRELPAELALLPVVESSYEPHAFSNGHASGLWQFIPSTGAHFGLKQNWWYDGRRDVYASTVAALDYLEQLHARFGDWLLALAAYNAGQGTVGRAIERNRKAGRPTTFWHLALPAETRRYVPKLLALGMLISDPERYGVDLPHIPNAPYFTAVEVGSQIDLALAARLAGIPMEELKYLNPGFKRWATDPEGPHRLLLPVQHAAVFEERLAEVPRERRMQWGRHVVQRGETLGHIARRHGTTVATLRQINGLRGDMIRAGRDLIVPLQPGAAALAGDVDSPIPPSPQAVHTVRAGDSLWLIARRHGITVEQLARWNGISPHETLRPGRELALRAPTTHEEHEAHAQPEVVLYTVRPGDSLWSISNRFRVSIEDLRKWNDLPKRGYLQPGDSLTLRLNAARRAGSI